MKIRSSGFTMIETLVVISIIGILIGGGMRYSALEYQRESVNALVIPLVAWLELVQKAALRGTGCTATIGSPSGADGVIATATVAVSGTNTTSTNENQCLQKQPFSIASSGDTRMLNQDFSITSTTISFTPRGTVVLENGDKKEIVVSLQPNGPSRCIQVEGLLAFISIRKGVVCGQDTTF